MRLVLEETTDRRWQIWRVWDGAEGFDQGDWLQTVKPVDLPRAVGELVGVRSRPDPGRSRRRSKGSGG